MAISKKSPLLTIRAESARLNDERKVSPALVFVAPMCQICWVCKTPTPKETWKLLALECKWNPRAKAGFSSTFTSGYPTAKTMVVTPENVEELLGY
jgi:hypothetical protein